jgi:hypothetical protein
MRESLAGYGPPVGYMVPSSPYNSTNYGNSGHGGGRYPANKVRKMLLLSSYSFYHFLFYCVCSSYSIVWLDTRNHLTLKFIALICMLELLLAFS